MLTFTISKQQPVNVGSAHDKWIMLPAGTTLAVEGDHNGLDYREVQSYYDNVTSDPVTVIVTKNGLTADFPSDAGVFGSGQPDNLHGQEELGARDAAKRYPEFASLYTNDQEVNEYDEIERQNEQHFAQLSEEHGNLSPHVYRYLQRTPSAATPFELAFLAGLYHDQALADEAAKRYRELKWAALHLDEPLARGTFARRVSAYVMNHPETLQVDIARALGVRGRDLGATSNALVNSALLTRRKSASHVVLSLGKAIGELRLDDENADPVSIPRPTRESNGVDSANKAAAPSAGPYWPRTIQDDEEWAAVTYSRLQEEKGPYSPATMRAARSLVEIAEEFIKPSWIGANYSTRVVEVARQAAYSKDDDLSNRVEGLVVLFEDNMRGMLSQMKDGQRAGTCARLVIKAVRRSPGVGRAGIMKSIDIEDYELTAALSDLIESSLVRREKIKNRFHYWTRQSPRDREGSRDEG